MEFFKCITKNIQIEPLLKEIKDNEELWLANTSRQDNIPVQRQTQTIYVRTPVARKDLNVNENQESEWSEHAKKFPLLCSLLEKVAAKLDGTLSRVAIVQLEPKGNVLLHIDHGTYYHIRDRYHLILKSKNGSYMMSGGEKALMKEGELWWFENNQYHQAMNNSDEWRIHVIFDVLPNKYAHLGKNALSLKEIDERMKAAAQK